MDEGVAGPTAWSGWMGEIASEFAPPPPTFSQQGGHVETGFALGMESPSGTVYYTLDGSDPRPSDPANDPALGTVLVAERVRRNASWCRPGPSMTPGGAERPSMIRPGSC